MKLFIFLINLIEINYIKNEPSIKNRSILDCQITQPKAKSIECG